MANRESKHFKFRDLEFWAQNGMVTVLDTERANENRPVEDCLFHMSPGEFIKRAIAVRMTVGDTYPDEQREASRFLEEATVVVKMAKAQGDLSDPNVVEHMIKHERKAQILVPNTLVGVDYKLQANDDPRNVILHGAYDVAPELSRPAAKTVPALVRRSRQ